MTVFLQILCLSGIQKTVHCSSDSLWRCSTLMHMWTTLRNCSEKYVHSGSASVFIAKWFNISVFDIPPSSHFLTGHETFRRCPQPQADAVKGSNFSRQVVLPISRTLRYEHCCLTGSSSCSAKKTSEEKSRTSVTIRLFREHQWDQLFREPFFISEICRC